MALAWRKFHLVIFHVGGFHAHHAGPFVVAKVCHRLGFGNPRVPDNRGVGLGLIDVDITIALGVVNGGGSCGVVDTIGFGFEDHWLVTLFVSAAFDFAQIAGALQAVDCGLVNITHVKIGVQRGFEGKLTVTSVVHVKAHGKAGAYGNTMGQFKIHRPKFACLFIAFECEDDLDAAIVLFAGGFEFPWEESGEAVGGRLFVVSALAEPWETDGHAASDGFVGCEFAFVRHEQDGACACGLKVGDVRTVEVDGGGSEWCLNMDAGQLALACLDAELAWEVEFLLKCSDGIVHGLAA